MSSLRLPKVFALLREERNLAADDALAAALPQMEPALQVEALEVLVARGHLSGLGQVIGNFSSSPEAVQSLILERVGDLYGGVRAAISAGSLEHRLAAIEVIERSGEYKLAYLLGAVLRSACGRTRREAGETLARMAGRHLDNPAEASTKDSPAGQAQRLVEALRHGIMSWEAHVRPEVLQAALWLGGRIEKTIREKLAEPRTNIAHAIGNSLVGTSDPRLASFTLQALAIPELRAAAAETISLSRETTFVRGLASACWLLADKAIRRSCVRIRELRWLGPDADIFSTLNSEQGAALVRLIGATGLRSSAKIPLYRAILGFADKALDRAVIWQLVENTSNASTEMLTALAGRGDRATSRIASRELKRRGLKTFLDEREFGGHAIESALADGGADPWEKYWRTFDHLSAGQRQAAGAALNEERIDLPTAIRAKLASALAPDRAKALRMTRELGLLKELAEQVYHLSSDHDSVVRSTAVSLLADLPGTTSRRILQRALNDTDDRVQANAISVLDALEPDGRRDWIEPKLESPDNRVRANAIKALLRMEFAHAGEVLLDMLDSSSSAQKLSGLWVVERLKLQTLIKRVENMGRSGTDKRVQQRAQRVLDGLMTDLGDEMIDNITGSAASPTGWSMGE